MDGYPPLVGVYSNQVKGPIFVFYGLSSGVTQVLFSHCGNYLYSGERKVLHVTNGCSILFITFCCLFLLLDFPLFRMETFCAGIFVTQTHLFLISIE